MTTRLLSCVLLCALGASVGAQPAHDDARAAALYDEGKRHFDLGEYRAAIAAWRQSYLLSNEPLLLFNIAQAYRLAGDCAQANRFYANYKRTVPAPSNRVELEQAMAVCANVEPATGDTDLPVEPSAPKTNPPAVVAPTAPPTPTSPSGSRMPSLPTPAASASDVSRGGALRITGLALAGAGVIAGVVAIVSAVHASNEASTISNEPAGTTWTGALSSDYSSGESAQTRARVLGAIGGAALVGGGLVWWLGHRMGNARVDVAIAPGHSQVSFSCAF
ncbi:MAG TPA: hypothetical protein VGG74_03920 [Kofleriaceae bacterium]|jgi:hypothetical protein